MPSVASRWAAYERRVGRGLPATSLASPLSPVTFPSVPLVGLVEIAPGADLTADPATWSWVDITQWVRHDMGISVTFGRRDQASFVDPSRATLKLDNRDGRFSRRNPVGPYYGQLTRNTPIRMAVNPGDGMHYRYYGFVNEWPKRWDKSGNDSTVTIQCGGKLRQLQRTQPLRSALFRTMAGVSPEDYTPHAYWSLEDGSEATQFASAVAGVGPLSFAGEINPGADSDLAGSDPLPTLGTTGLVAFSIPPYTNQGQCVIQWAMKVPSEPGAEITLAEFYGTGGPINRWRITCEPGSPSNIWIRDLDASGAIVNSTGIPLNGNSNANPSESDFYDNWAIYTFAIEQVDTFVDAWFGLSVGPPAGGVGAANGAVGTVGRLTGGKLFGTSLGCSVGHVVVYTDPGFNPRFGGDALNNVEAMHGYAGELAHERVIRICREESIPLRCVAGTSAALGPQPTGSVVDVLRDAERADVGGVLYEHEFGLGYQALSERYAQPVQLSLDFDQGHVGDPPEADDSDLRFRNQWTAARDGGSSATVLHDDYNPADGLVPGQATVNAYRDDQLPHIAGWLVHRDTADEDYWTGLQLRFSRTPDIIPAWTSLPFGARLNVANPPSQADPGDIDAIVEGWSERWDQVSWTATLNTSPASVLEVPVWDDPGFLWDSGSSSLTSDIAAGATSISVTTTNADDLWVTGAVAFDIEIGGEQISVTNISGASSPQTFTVTRAVNGISKGHSAGADVRLWNSPIWGLT